MRQLARHHGMVVGILLMMVCFFAVEILASFNPAPVFAGALKANWNANTETDLAGYKIYYGESSGNYAASIDVGKITQYTINQLKDGVVYYFAITAFDSAGNESGYSLEVSAKVILLDTTPPAVSSVTPRHLNTLEIKFSEAVSLTSAQTKTNYVIDNGVTVASATLQPDNITVVLGTSAHETGKTHKITIQNIADRAPTPNTMARAVSFNYLLPVIDKTPPTVTTFRAVDRATLELVFNEPVSLSSAQTATNYTVTNNVTVQNAKLQPDNRTVTLTTSQHATSVNHTLTVRNIADRAPAPNVMSQPATFNYNFPTVDNVAPSVANVRIVNGTTIEVFFSEPVTSISAQTKSNYLISRNIVIANAVLKTDARTVVLTTGQHVDAQAYTLTVNNIFDRATPANKMAPPATFTYTYQAEDLQAPEVSSVAMTDLTHVTVVFNEPITQVSAQNKANYLISDGVQVQQAALSSSGLEVTLTTASHQYNKDYNLTVVNIKDRAPAANTMAANTTRTYKLTNNNNGGNNSGLSVNGLNLPKYAFGTLQVGESYYVDRPAVIRQIPESKRGLLMIKTALTDRTNRAERFLEFNLTREANIYVAYDSRATQPPDWLKNFFTDTGEDLVVSEQAAPLHLWKSRFGPRRIILGGNMASGAQAGASLSMYVVMVEDVQLSGTDPSAPQSFVLQQNYPNPFSRSGSNGSLNKTTINFSLLEENQVILTIHNALGQKVRELYNGLKPAGKYPITWDGRDDNGNLLPSGTYLCTLEVRQEVNDAGFTMSASLSRQTRVMTLLK